MLLFYDPLLIEFLRFLLLKLYLDHSSIKFNLDPFKYPYLESALTNWLTIFPTKTQHDSKQIDDDDSDQQFEKSYRTIDPEQLETKFKETEQEISNIPQVKFQSALDFSQVNTDQTSSIKFRYEIF